MLAARNHPINCGTLAGSTARKFAKFAIEERSFDITASEVRRIVSPGALSTVTKDKNGTTAGTPLKVFSRQVSAGYETDFAIAVSPLKPGYFKASTFSSDDESVLAVAGENAVFNAPGQCTLRVTSVEGETSLTRVVSSSSQSSTVDTFSSWASGSLAAHCVNQIDSMISGRTQANVYDVADGTTFSRNPNCWANAIDVSCASPWNSSHGNQRGGTLISPRHVLFCLHADFYPPVGATLAFVAQSGAVVFRQLQAIERLVDVADFTVGLLDAGVGEGVTFARVLPGNYGSYLPSLDDFSTVPAMFFDQNENAHISGVRALANVYITAFSPAYADYYDDVIVGDSGKPSFLVINSQAVLLGVHSTPKSGSHVAHAANAINAAMTTLGGGYQLTSFDLSGFPTY
jgi:hypothetical protein